MRLEQAKFRSWLEAKPPTEIVGEQRTCHACPIANFYHEASGCEVVIFERDGEYYLDRGYSKKLLPAWASNFVFDVDDNANCEITAGRALELLTAA